MTAIEWFDALQWIHIVLIVAILLLFVGYIYLIKKVTQLEFVGGLVGKWKIRFVGSLFGLLVVIYLFYNLYNIQPNGWVEISLLAGLVAATGALALMTLQQADASVKMAKEMREQRRPIVVSEVMFPTHLGVTYATKDDEGDITCDHFKIRNLGNSPAIELEVLLLNQEEGLLNGQRQTFLAQSDAPVEFYPQGLEGQLNSTCYLLCRYRSSEEGKMWYLTKLPFVPIKSQRGDRIIIQPKELEFSSAFEKRSY